MKELAELLIAKETITNKELEEVLGKKKKEDEEITTTTAWLDSLNAVLAYEFIIE